MLGVWLAILSAACFGSSGPFGKSLVEAGWSPTAAVTVRIGGAAVALAAPTLVALRGRWRVLADHAGLVAVYGVVAMAGCQLFYFLAVERLSVGVALLIEYTAPVLIIGWLWARSGVRPSRLTLLGVAASLVGLVLVLDVAGAVEVDLIGAAWAFAAAVCVAVYFLLSARDLGGLPPLVLAGAGMVVAALTLVLLVVVGLLPWTSSAADVAFVGHHFDWWVPALAMILLSTALAYTTGIGATRILGSRLASFFGLGEVMFAVLFAWLLLGELPVPIQLVGGAFIVAGIACIRYDEVVPRVVTEPGERGKGAVAS